MKYLRLLFATGLIAAMAGCNYNCITPSGNQISQNRSVSPFTSVDVGGSVKLFLRQGSTPGVRIVADDNLQKEIRTKVSGQTLNIDIEGTNCNYHDIRIYLTALTFERINASGDVAIESEGKLNVDDFELGLSGSAKVMLDINARSVSTRSSGSAGIGFKGQAGTHNVDLSGSAEVHALDFVVGKYNINTSGASEMHINVLNELNISSSGSSDVEYRGNPKTINNDESGASSLTKIQ